MLANKFIYDLFGRPKPTEIELQEETDRLLMLRTTEEPNFLVKQEDQDQSTNFDIEVIGRWIEKKFRPALLLLLLVNTDNYPRACDELSKMERYVTIIDRLIRPKFVYYQALQRTREILFAHESLPELSRIINDLRRTLTFLSEHLNNTSNLTLMDTVAYTHADVLLYRYLKRIMVGKYIDLGLRNHVKLCDPLIRFMHRFATKNTNVIDVSLSDPLANKQPEVSLVADIVKPATVAAGFILFYLWRRRE